MREIPIDWLDQGLTPLAKFEVVPPASTASLTSPP
jgi:hypothetical protein